MTTSAANSGPKALPALPPDLENRLCQPFAPARCELGYARRFGVEDRRSPADECDGQKDRREAGGEGQREESRQRETHSRGQ